MGGSRSVKRIHLITREEVVYPSASEAARQNDGKSSNIVKVCKGFRLSGYGFFWEYVEDPKLENERWLNHPTIDHLLVSDKGRIQAKNGRITYGSLAPNGYRMYTKYKTKNHCVHRLVAETFLENEYEKLVVHHIDRNRQNNKVENLKWVTQKENVGAYHALIPKLY